jgi:hypothetical protein
MGLVMVTASQKRVAASRRKPAPTGRPVKAADEALQSYGLHISPEARARMVRIKDRLGVSVREWLEGVIAYQYDELFHGRPSAAQLRVLLDDAEAKLATANAELTTLRASASAMTKRLARLDGAARRAKAKR